MAIAEILADCAARRRAEDGTPDDPQQVLLAVAQPPRGELVFDVGYPRPRKVMRSPAPISDVLVEPGEFLEPDVHPLFDEDHQYRASDAEMPWRMLDDDAGMTRIEEAVASVKAARLSAPSGEGVGGGDLVPQPATKPKRRKK